MLLNLWQLITSKLIDYADDFQVQVAGEFLILQGRKNWSYAWLFIEHLFITGYKQEYALALDHLLYSPPTIGAWIACGFDHFYGSNK